MPFVNIVEDPDVCSNCFRRKRERFERNYRLETYFDEDEGEWSVRPVNVQGITITIAGEEEIVGGMEDDVYRDYDNTIKIPERGSIRGLRTVCRCGYRYDGSEDWRNRPLRKSTFFEYAEYLRDRMRENGVDFDEDAFFEKLDELKSDPDKQFADDRIFKQACDHASEMATIRS